MNRLTIDHSDATEHAMSPRIQFDKEGLVLDDASPFGDPSGPLREYQHSNCVVSRDPRVYQSNSVLNFVAV